MILRHRIIPYFLIWTGHTTPLVIRGGGWWYRTCKIYDQLHDQADRKFEKIYMFFGWVLSEKEHHYLRYWAEHSQPKFKIRNNKNTIPYVYMSHKYLMSEWRGISNEHVQNNKKNNCWYTAKQNMLPVVFYQGKALWYISRIGLPPRVNGLNGEKPLRQWIGDGTYYMYLFRLVVHHTIALTSKMS